MTEVHGRWLLSLIWAVALIGILLKFVAPHRVDPLSVPLYLTMGWAGLSDPELLLSLPAPVVTLLVAGGVFYTVGITFHLARVPFQEVIWHCFVLVAAACHYAAVVSIHLTFATDTVFHNHRLHAVIRVARLGVFDARGCQADRTPSDHQQRSPHGPARR